MATRTKLKPGVRYGGETNLKHLSSESELIDAYRQHYMASELPSSTRLAFLRAAQKWKTTRAGIFAEAVLWDALRSETMSYKDKSYCVTHFIHLFFGSATSVTYRLNEPKDLLDACIRCEVWPSTSILDSVVQFYMDKEGDSNTVLKILKMYSEFSAPLSVRSVELLVDMHMIHKERLRENDASTEEPIHELICRLQPISVPFKDTVERVAQAFVYTVVKSGGDPKHKQLVDMTRQLARSLLCNVPYHALVGNPISSEHINSIAFSTLRYLEEKLKKTGQPRNNKNEMFMFARDIVENTAQTADGEEETRRLILLAQIGARLDQLDNVCAFLEDFCRKSSKRLASSPVSFDTSFFNQHKDICSRLASEYSHLFKLP